MVLSAVWSYGVGGEEEIGRKETLERISASKTAPWPGRRVGLGGVWLVQPSLEKSGWQKREEGEGAGSACAGRAEVSPTPATAPLRAWVGGSLSTRLTLCLFPKPSPTCFAVEWGGGGVGAGQVWSGLGGNSLPPVLPLVVEKSQGISPAEKERNLGGTGKEEGAQKGLGTASQSLKTSLPEGPREKIPSSYSSSHCLEES